MERLRTHERRARNCARPSGVRRLAWIILALVIVAVLLPARPASAAVRLEVEAGFDGYHYPSVHIPVRVRIDTEGLVRGTLEIVLEDWNLAVTRDIEVPGGSTKEFVELAPSPRSGDLIVRVLDEDGKRLAHRVAPLQVSWSEELVGLLPGAAGSRPLPGPQPLAVDVGTARFTHLEPVLLERAPLGLFSLGTIGAVPSDLSQLTSPQRDGLLRWVSSGGRLLVDAEPGIPVAGVPERWHPDATGRAPANLGEIVLTGDALGSGRLAGLTEPTLRVPQLNLLRRSSQSSPYYATARDIGVRAPSLTWLFGAVGLYALVAGPLAYWGLRRMRRELWLWAVIPGLAVTITLASYVGARTLRHGGEMARHQTLITSTPLGGLASSFVAFLDPAGGDVPVSFPADWPWLVGSPLWGAEAETSRIVSGPGSPQAVVPLNPSQVGVVAGTGPVDVGDGLDITAHTDGDDVRGTVHNGTPLDLSSVAVIVGPAWRKIGSLASGASKEFVVTASSPGTSAGPPGSSLWPPTAAASPPESWALWERTGETSPDYAPTGDALVVGWTDDHRARVTLDDQDTRVEGRSLVTARTPIGHDGGPAPDLAVRRTQVRGQLPDHVEPGWLGVGGPNDPLVLRFTLPPAADVSTPLTLTAPEGLARVELWKPDGWSTVYDDPNAPPTAGSAIRPSFGYSSPTPEKAYAMPSTGERIVYVRITQPDGTARSASAFTLRQVDQEEPSQ